MNVWPLKFRDRNDGSVLFADDAGGFFLADAPFLSRYAEDRLRQTDISFLQSNGHTFEVEHDLAWTSFAYKWSRRQARPDKLNYLILVPTLRCNLACPYCQVSRVAETAKGFDWDETTLHSVIEYLDGLTTEEIKVEFQGGEPLLRLDLLAAVRDFCRKRFKRAQFVVCTNLQSLGHEEWDFLCADDTFVSTSLDGDFATHQRQRTKNGSTTTAFFENLSEAARRLGPDRLSALPTIEPASPPNFDMLLDNYEQLGIRSIYLRPINHQGFARRLTNGDAPATDWNRLYNDFIDRLIERNAKSESTMEEYYFSQCLRRVLQLGADSHVDLRNPNFFATNYLVIDYDGRLYPTDEARMLTRIGRIDLSIGLVGNPIDQPKVDLLNSASLNNFDADCIHCPYQPFCGTDVIDDLSRYGRIDLRKPDTWFCQRHVSVFDKVFDMIYSGDQKVQRSLAAWLGLAQWPSTLGPVHS